MSKLVLNYACVILLGLSLFSSNSHADTKKDLTIVDGATQHVVKDEDFRLLHLDSVEVNDPVYGHPKRYEGYWLRDLFRLEGIHPDPDTVWTFTALDGYKAEINAADVLRTGMKAFVAVRDLDAPGDWIKIKQGKEMVSPGPYYLVWQTPLNSPPEIKLPWPYQVIQINIRNVKEDKENLFPDDPNRSESAGRGYKVFQQNCISCHSLNLAGGGLGPELNVPKNILEYESPAFLKAFINDPSSFRAKSKMPSFKTTLTTQELNNLLDYLAWMGKHKKTGTH